AQDGPALRARGGPHNPAPLWDTPNPSIASRLMATTSRVKPALHRRGREQRAPRARHPFPCVAHADQAVGANVVHAREGEGPAGPQAMRAEVGRGVSVASGETRYLLCEPFGPRQVNLEARRTGHGRELRVRAGEVACERTHGDLRLGLE